MDSLYTILDAPLVVTLLMLLLAGLVIRWMIARRRPKKPRRGTPMTRRDREAGAVFIPATLYSRIRNPMRFIRRSFGELSGRQWVKLRKHHERQMPGGLGRLATLIQELQRTGARRRQTPSPPSAARKETPHDPTL